MAAFCLRVLWDAVPSRLAAPRYVAGRYNRGLSSPTNSSPFLAHLPPSPLAVYGDVLLCVTNIHTTSNPHR